MTENEKNCIVDAKEYLLKKGINKVHQPDKRFNLSIEELVIFLDEFAMEQKEKSPERFEMDQLRIWG